MRHSAKIVGPILIALLSGCASYPPEPLDPASVTYQFEARSLSDPKLCEYLKANLKTKRSSCLPSEWDLATLTLVGFYYSPELHVAEARVCEADAAVVTAGARPNPSVQIGPQYVVRSTPNFVPWAIGTFSLDLPIETAGKRGYRIAQAEHLADAARLAIGEAAWTVRSQIRATLLAYLLDLKRRDLAFQDEHALEEGVSLIVAQVETGETSRLQLDLAQSAVENARLKLAEAEARVPSDRAALAGALGLPPSALDNTAFAWSLLDHPPAQALLSAATIQRLALLNRVDLRRQLEQYAAVNEALKLELARQYPDLNLFGGYSWEAGENIFELGPSLVLPVFNQNQGPIAEAEARRARTAAQFMAAQASVISQSHRALITYRGSLQELDAATRAAAAQARHFDQTKAAFAVGETDAFALAQAQLLMLASRQNLVEAVSNAQTALGGLEDSVQRPLDDGDVGAFSFAPPQPSGELTSP